MQSIISISNLTKTYASGFRALRQVDLEIRRGEIFALLGPNGAGKTTLINIVCGIVNASAGTVLADGHDIVTDYRAARALIGLVPQELATDAFESVWATVTFSRGLFGKPPNPAYIEQVLRDLSLWDRKDSKIMAQARRAKGPSSPRPDRRLGRQARRLPRIRPWARCRGSRARRCLSP